MDFIKPLVNEINEHIFEYSKNLAGSNIIDYIDMINEKKNKLFLKICNYIFENISENYNVDTLYGILNEHIYCNHSLQLLNDLTLMTQLNNYIDHLKLQLSFKKN
jgi:hypothetical protein